jgi:hypothetical protein
MSIARLRHHRFFHTHVIYIYIYIYILTSRIIYAIHYKKLLEKIGRAELEVISGKFSLQFVVNQ